MNNPAIKDLLYCTIPIHPVSNWLDLALIFLQFGSLDYRLAHCERGATPMEQATKQIRTRPCPRCFLCDVEGKLLYQNLTARMFSAPGQWDFRICPLAGCGLMWLDPTPVTEDLPVAYDSYFTHGRTDGPLGAAALLR